MSYYHKAREQRFLAGIADCDLDITEEVLALDDAVLVQEALDRSGLSSTEFAEDVLFIDQATLWRYRSGALMLPMLVRRFLLREIVRVRHRIRHRTLPESTRCPACGRGQDDDRPLLAPHLSETRREDQDHAIGDIGRGDDGAQVG